jgi:hypothetical protein
MGGLEICTELRSEISWSGIFKRLSSRAFIPRPVDVFCAANRYISSRMVKNSHVISENKLCYYRQFLQYLSL